MIINLKKPLVICNDIIYLFGELNVMLHPRGVKEPLNFTPSFSADRRYPPRQAWQNIARHVASSNPNSEESFIMQPMQPHSLSITLKLSSLSSTLYLLLNASPICLARELPKASVYLLSGWCFASCIFISEAFSIKRLIAASISFLPEVCRKV